jgi:WD40 repeat protein
MSAIGRTYHLLMCAVIVTALPVYGQVSPQMLDYPQNHLPWFTIESDNFLVHYQEGSYRSAAFASLIAEEIYEPVTNLYGHHPKKKVSIVIRDREDFSNGAAYFFDDKIEIWLPALDTPLRGTHHWLRNVITHEFVHIVQLGASMKRSQTIPAFYLQWLSYEDVRRPDVLYGFPNGLITKPFATVSIPAWFAEGTAQYQHSTLGYDSWDSHRDMMLRTRVLDNSVLGFEEMGIFSSKTSLERELAYNQGFAFTNYLTERFGEEVIADISRSAAESGRNNFSPVMLHATGYSGHQLYDDWLSHLREKYRQVTEQIGPVSETETVEPRGFFNFYPQYSSDGSVFAYLSNRGRDYARTALILKKNGLETEIEMPGGLDYLNGEQSYHFSHGLASNTTLDFISNRFSFSPAGNELVYSRPVRNRFGETYQDLYIYNLDSASRERITNSARVQDPAWHPKERLIAAVKQTHGTQNLVLVDPAGGDITQLTVFKNWETVYTPVWHPDGDDIYFASASAGNRNIFRYHLPSETITAVLAGNAADFRDPWISPDGRYLYYSADITGIFNIYRLNLETGHSERVTNVIGGAFMPFARGDTLYFAGYTARGYKIERAVITDPVSVNPDTISKFRREANPYAGDLDGIPDRSPEISSAAAEPVSIVISGDDTQVNATWQPYSETTTGISVFPVLRFDNYTKLRGSNRTLLTDGRFGALGENLWRDVKLGAYFSSRDVTERLSLFAGALIGPGSLPADGVGDFFSPGRLNNLDRDLFLIAEYRGLPFIRRSWSPTVAVELYNLKRNVRDGITIEEFACTSCLPEERSIDIRYSIWEASLFLRSKLNRWSLLELGASYSPYSVTTDGFFSREFNEFIPGSTSQYFRGSTYSVSYVAELFRPVRHSDIAPQGIGGSFTYRYQPGRLLSEFEVNDGILSPVYSRDFNHSLELNTRYGFGIYGRSTGMFETRGFAYLNRPDEFFYLDYTGGLTGMRSYPFFAIGGQTTAFGRISYITPLFEGINRQAGAYTLDKVFARLFLETGNGWGGPLNIGNNLKTGAGAELRFAFNNYYLFPMKLFVNGTYGFNRFDVSLPSQFITPDGGSTVSYGRDFLFYFGLTFDFDL